jgi:hypothetical protein
MLFSTILYQSGSRVEADDSFAKMKEAYMKAVIIILDELSTMLPVCVLICGLWINAQPEAAAQ